MTRSPTRAKNPTPPSPGDIFQILTGDGVCYGQMTHHTYRHGEVIAIYRRFWSAQPVNWSEVVSAPPQFITTFLLAQAVRHRYFAIVGHADVPEAQRPIPNLPRHK